MSEADVDLKPDVKFEEADDDDEELTVASKVPFRDLCLVLEKISKTRKAERRDEILLNFITKWRQAHALLHKSLKTDDSFFPAMRLILPSFDKDRGAYGLKEKKLGDLIAAALTLDKHSTDAQKLVNYKAPTSKSNEIGDFAATAASVLKYRLKREQCDIKISKVRAAEITSSVSYGVGYTLRFPRVVKIRADKGFADCMTAKEFDDLRQECDGKLAQRKRMEINDDDNDGSSPAKKRRGGRVVVKPTVEAAFLQSDLRDVKRKANAFNGREVCIMDNSANKGNLERIVAELGGTVVQNPGMNTMCVVAPTVTIRVKSVIAANSHNVVKPDWLMCCSNESRLVPFAPAFMFHTLLSTQATFRGAFDEFGDSYTEPVTVDQLKTILNKVEPAKLSSDEQAEWMEQLLDDYKYALFRRCRVYVDRYLILHDRSTSIPLCSLTLIEASLKLYGALVVDNLSEAVCSCQKKGRSARRVAMDKFEHRLDE
uniref:DNA ligase IV n=1 Tax=Plectus sambesii TaxID=2011161 RepID=A0A914W548_9BILA